MRSLPLLAAALFAAGATASSAVAAPPPKPKLIVAISVDQFALDLYQRYRSDYAGGLKRLSDGLVFTGYQSHAATETCPGHSTLLTGDHPSRTGIVANNWYDRATGSNVYCVTALEAPSDPLAKSSAQLKVDTLGDLMRAANPASRVVSVSFKDRAAIMMAGHHPTAVYWWDDNGVGFDTSRYAGPADARTLGLARSFDQALFAEWSHTAPALWPSLPQRCAALQQPHTFGKLAISGQVPPDSARDALEGGFVENTSFDTELRASPLADSLTERMAERLVDAYGLGRGPATDLLAISFSATDLVGHRYGNGGAESCAQVAALDETLGRLFAKLDGLAVPYVVVLTADHGAIDAPERLGSPATRIDVLGVLGALSAHLRQRFGLAYDPFVGDDPRQLILSLPPEDEKRRAEIVADAVAWLRARPEVAGAYTAEEIAAAKPPRGKSVTDLTVPERFNESFYAPRNGDILVSWKESATLGVPAGAGAIVASHGSPWDYDRRVPILFWWKGVAPENEPAPMETVDIAPTLAPLVGIACPASTDDASTSARAVQPPDQGRCGKRARTPA